MKNPPANTERPGLSDADLLDSPYASPPCLLGELDPVWLGGLSAVEIGLLLNQLLNMQKQGVGILASMERDSRGAPWCDLVAELKRGAAARCEILQRYEVRFSSNGGERSHADTRPAMLPSSPLAPNLARFVEIQELAARTIREALPRLFDDDLAGQLHRMAQRCDEAARRSRASGKL